MKILSRDFTLAERILLVLLSVVLLGLLYYQFVDQPVRTSISSARTERDSLQMELDTVTAQVNQLSSMQSELDQLKTQDNVNRMASYNNSKAELALLNDALRAANTFAISFADVTRDGNQIRRNFSLQFTASDYATMKQIFSDLTNGPYRCLIGDISCSVNNQNDVTGLSVSATATFYETMVGGTPDAGLPADTSAEPDQEVSSFDSAVVGASGANASISF